MRLYDKISLPRGNFYKIGSSQLDTVSVKEKGGLEPAVEAVREALSGIEDPHMKKDLVAAGEVDEVIVDGDVAFH